MSRTTWEVYRWVRKERWRKKKNLYQQSFHLVFDKTTLVYTTVFFVIFLIMLNDWLQRFFPIMGAWQQVIMAKLWILPFALTLKAVVQSFTTPGILFTSAELKLSQLPHSKNIILLYIVIDKLILQAIFLLAVGGVIAPITPFPVTLILQVICIYFLMALLTILIQWKLFSMSKWLKILLVSGLLITVTAIRFIAVSFNSYGWLLSVSIIVLTLFITIYLLPKVTNAVDWMKVVDVNNYKVWNMRWISQVTNVKILPPRKYGFVQTYLRSRRATKRYDRIESLYHRLWKSHFQVSFSYIWKVAAACVALIVVIPLKLNWMIFIGVPVGLFIYVQVLCGIFREHFSVEPLVTVIPIDERGWISTFKVWAFVALIPIYLSFGLFSLVHSTDFWVLFTQSTGLIVWAYLDLKIELKNTMKDLLKERYSLNDWSRFIGYLILAVGLYYPIAMLLLAVWVWRPQRIKRLIQS